MLELARSVRFCVNPALPPDPATAPRFNTFAAWPAMAGLGAFYEMDIRCRGPVDHVTGYMMNISVIDEAVRRVVVPIVHQAVRVNPLAEPGALLPSIVTALQAELDAKVASVRWRLTPYYSVAMSSQDTDCVVIAQQFEFAAAHRLNCASLSPEENLAMFGRCNNPNSHGHNYRVEVAVRVSVDGKGDPFSLADLERLVHERIIKRFDHKNLNIDVAEFAAMNPSVENIAKVCHDLIASAISETGAQLAHVTVWETEKTSCTYSG